MALSLDKLCNTLRSVKIIVTFEVTTLLPVAQFGYNCFNMMKFSVSIFGKTIFFCLLILDVTCCLNFFVLTIKITVKKSYHLVVQYKTERNC